MTRLERLVEMVRELSPEEFATFLLGQPKIRKAFLKHHRNLLEPRFWQEAQAKIRDGHVEDFYPYPQELRFCNAFPPEAPYAAPLR